MGTGDRGRPPRIFAQASGPQACCAFSTVTDTNCPGPQPASCCAGCVQTGSLGKGGQGSQPGSRGLSAFWAGPHGQVGIRGTCPSPSVGTAPRLPQLKGPGPVTGGTGAGAPRAVGWSGDGLQFSLFSPLPLPGLTSLRCRSPSCPLPLLPVCFMHIPRWTPGLDGSDPSLPALSPLWLPTAPGPHQAPQRP